MHERNLIENSISSEHIYSIVSAFFLLGIPACANVFVCVHVILYLVVMMNTNAPLEGI